MQLITGTKIWVYVSADVDTDVDAADYFSDGDALGMAVGDLVLVQENSSGSTPYRTSSHVVNSVTAGGAATVGLPVEIGNEANA